MEEEEPVRAVLRVQRVDARRGGRDEVGIFRPGLFAGVGEVAEQREMQVVVAVGEEADLELVEQRQQPLLRVDDRRDDDEGAIALGNAVAQVELRQRPRVDLRRHASG